jgi:hypothetical protein
MLEIHVVFGSDRWSTTARTTSHKQHRIWPRKSAATLQTTGIDDRAHYQQQAWIGNTTLCSQPLEQPPEKGEGSAGRRPGGLSKQGEERRDEWERVTVCFIALFGT